MVRDGRREKDYRDLYMLINLDVRQEVDQSTSRKKYWKKSE
jgi:hypothetical protein